MNGIQQPCIAVIWISICMLFCIYTTTCLFFISSFHHGWYRFFFWTFLYKNIQTWFQLCALGNDSTVIYLNSFDPDPQGLLLYALYLFLFLSYWYIVCLFNHFILYYNCLFCSLSIRCKAQDSITTSCITIKISWV